MVLTTENMPRRKSVQIYTVGATSFVVGIPRTPPPPETMEHAYNSGQKYRKYPRIMHTFSTKILTSKLGVRIICGYIGIQVCS